MPSVTTPQGRQAFIPGVYSGFDVVSDVPGPLPEFQVPILIGEAEKGYPFDVKSKQFGHENLSEFILRGTSSSAASFYGVDSDISVAMKSAKRHNLPQSYLVGINDLTRATIVANSAGPVAEFTVSPQLFGAGEGHHKIRWSAGILEVTPIRNSSRATADIGVTDTRIFVRDNSWVKVDTDITIGDNANTNITRTVVAVGSDRDSAGQVVNWVELDSAPGALTTAEYAIILEYDENDKETSPTFVAGEGQLLLDWLQFTSALLNGDKATGTFTGTLPIDVATATALKDIAAWGAVVGGTSPAQTSTNHDDFISDLNASELDAFALSEQSVPQSFCIVSGDSTVHASWRDWAITRRNDGYAVSITTGVRWGDIVLNAGDDTDPLFRAGVLNSQDVMLCVGGIDRLDAYLSYGPAVWGKRLGGGIPHNLTNDDFFYEELETQWDERESGEETALHKAGLCIYRLSIQQSVRFRISQGLSTLQDNLVAWNETTDDTPLVMQRDLADFVDRILKLDLDGLQVGADSVSADSVAATVVRRAEKSLIRRGLILDFKVTSVTLNASSTGFDVTWSIRLPVTNDFITLVTTINIGEGTL